MKSCCPQGSWPQLSVEYKSKGNKVEVQGISIYHVGEGPHSIVILSDIFGATSGRHEAVADIFASLGYNVFLPQILCPPLSGPVDFPALMQCIKNQPLQILEQRFATTLNYMESKGIKEYFSIGFCWGVWFAFKMATKYQGFKAIMGLHPSIGIQSKFFNKSQIQLTENIKCPAYLLPAANDPANVKNKGEIVQLLIKKFGQQKVGVTEFPEMQHGWVIRGDMANQAVARDVDKAINLTHSYFSRFK